MARRRDQFGDWIDGETDGGGLSLLGWGFGSVVAFVLAFASWQYAPPRNNPAATIRADVGAPDPSEITGSIAATDTGSTVAQSSRTVGIGRLAPIPLAVDETPATSRDIARLQAEIAEIRRRIVQIGMAGDGVSRRLDGIEERVSGLPTVPDVASLPGIPEKPVADSRTDADRTVAADAAKPEPRVAERLPTPTPRPVHVPPTGGFDAEGPTTTGAVPKPARPIESGEAKAAKVDAPAEEKVVKSSRLAVATQAASPIDAARPAATAPEGPPRTATVPPPSPAPTTATADEAVAKTVRVVSPQPPTTAAVPTASAPASGGPAVAIDLGGYRTLASLRRAWSDTTLRHTELAKGYEPLARLRETDSGMEARLLAGPFADQTEAAKACLRIKALGGPCAVSTYSGQPVGGLR
ncbi:MAG: SPOR domain-containing protein [Siculibacillus sp.]|nr:SPOR domain-containing protein [Siculibacillus sp.]